MDIVQQLSRIIPVVKSPRKVLSFQERLKWTGVILILYFILASIPIFGGEMPNLDIFSRFAILLGGYFGSIISLGIGPIVMAAIILQLLVGGGLIEIDTRTPEGRARYNDMLRALIVVFAALEAIVHSTLGFFKPVSPIYIPIVALQLFLGAILITILDDFSVKWGITSGVNLFILAAISREFIARFFNPETGIVTSLISALNIGDLASANRLLIIIIFTFAVLALAAYLQSLRIEIPLTLARMRGRSFRWPINFLYTSVIPIILLYALWLNFQLIGMWLSKLGLTFIARFDEAGNIIGGFLYYLRPPHLITTIGTLSQLLQPGTILNIILYWIFYIGGAALLSYIWVHAAGMDAKSLASQLQSIGAGIIGYARDPRMLERILDRYIKPVSIWGGAAVGLLVAITDTLGLVLSGTSLLLAVMIAYNIYEDLARQQVLGLIPYLGKILSK